MARGRVQFERSMFRNIARSREVRDLIKDAADAGSAIARASAPEYVGPTYDPSVQRSGEYRSLIFSEVEMGSFGWIGKFGSDAEWALQVEFGTGGGRRNRDSQGRFRRVSPRPQEGYSPAYRTLGRSLDAIRIT
jgi:hypothetical protein